MGSKEKIEIFDRSLHYQSWEFDHWYRLIAEAGTKKLYRRDSFCEILGKFKTFVVTDSNEPDTFHFGPDYEIPEGGWKAVKPSKVNWLQYANTDQFLRFEIVAEDLVWVFGSLETTYMDNKLSKEAARQLWKDLVETNYIQVADELAPDWKWN